MIKRLILGHRPVGKLSDRSSSGAEMSTVYLLFQQR
jgi:hypothetical protein